MRPVVLRHCVETLYDFGPIKDADPLAYADRPGARGRGPTEQIDDLVAIATAAVQGRDTAAIDRLLTFPSDDRMDPVTAALLEDLGIVPAVALVLRTLLVSKERSLHIADRRDPDATMVMGTVGPDWVVTLGADAAHKPQWYSDDHSLQILRIPDTVASGISGCRLSDVVRHEVLDRFTLRIAHVETLTMLCTVHVEGVPESLGRDALIARYRKTLNSRQTSLPEGEDR